MGADRARVAAACPAARPHGRCARRPARLRGAERPHLPQRRHGRGGDDGAARAGAPGSQLRLSLRLDPQPGLRRPGGGSRRGVDAARCRRVVRRRPAARGRRPAQAGLHDRRRPRAGRASASGCRATRVERTSPATGSTSSSSSTRSARRCCCSRRPIATGAWTRTAGVRRRSPCRPSRSATTSPTPASGSSSRRVGRTAGCCARRGCGRSPGGRRRRPARGAPDWDARADALVAARPRDDRRALGAGRRRRSRRRLAAARRPARRGAGGRSARACDARSGARAAHRGRLLLPLPPRRGPLGEAEGAFLLSGSAPARARPAGPRRWRRCAGCERTRAGVRPARAARGGVRRAPAPATWQPARRSSTRCCSRARSRSHAERLPRPRDAARGPCPGRSGSGAQRPARRVQRAVEQHRARSARGRGSTRCAARRDGGHTCARERSARSARRASVPRAAASPPACRKPGDPAAARDVGLQHVDGRRAAARSRTASVAVLARRDGHPGRRPLADAPQPREVVRGHRLLEPADVRSGEARAPSRPPAWRSRRRWRRPSAPRRRRSPRAPRRPGRGRRAGSRPTFIFTRAKPVRRPAAELRAQPLVASSERKPPEP